MIHDFLYFSHFYHSMEKNFSLCNFWDNWKWPLVCFNPNISASTWPKSKVKDSFEILRTSRFQNWPYFLNLVKIWWRYWQKTNCIVFLWTRCSSLVLYILKSLPFYDVVILSIKIVVQKKFWNQHFPLISGGQLSIESHCSDPLTGHMASLVSKYCLGASGCNSY